tara:strand:- start:429 stop:953 length:525 start_codon:yes stop_codon:yes gene_type:complete
MRLLLAVFYLFFVVGCSFNSSQFNFVSNFFNKKSEVNAPKKNWMIEWDNKKIEIYAINLKNQIVFADENVNIFFNGEYIYKITGLLSSVTEINIKHDGNKVEYITDDQVIAKHLCESMKTSYTIESLTAKTQRCAQVSNKQEYTNEITLNSENMIISLIFVIHPDFPKIKISKI